MSTDANAYGNFLSSLPPFVSNYAAISGPFGTLVKPGGRIAAYVRSTGAQDGEDHFAASGLLVSTIGAGLKRCRSGKGDVVFVLPGHTESVSSADFFSDLVAGTQLIALGRPGASNNPTLTWTATASTFLLDVADVTVMGFNMNMAGINDVVAPITFSAAGCALIGNFITLQDAAASAGAVTPITVASGANNCVIAGNKMLSDDAGEPQTNVISITGAVDNLEIAGNRINCTLASATAGIVQVGAAATNLDIHDNLFYNTVEDGICIRVADTFAATGWVYRNFGKTIDAGGTVANTAKLVSFEGTTESLLGCFENYATDEATASGVISPAGATS
jgi:hypothetical protein